MNIQLLLTFSTVDTLTSSVTEVLSYFTPIDGRIFTLQSVDNPNIIYLTYNIHKMNYANKPPKTMLVHRKKESNTIYTINAINEISKAVTGTVDSRYRIIWNNYRNSVLLTDSNGLVERKTNLYEIFDT